MSRYVITERAQAEAPADTDRGAGAVARASGVYDLRDTQADRVICSTRLRPPWPEGSPRPAGSAEHRRGARMSSLPVLCLVCLLSIWVSASLVELYLYFAW
jgi:hypothetical protein